MKRSTRPRLVAHALTALGLLGATAACFPEGPGVVEPMPMPTPGGEIACEEPVFPGLPKDALPPGLGKQPLPAPVVLADAQRPTPARHAGHALAVHGDTVFAVDRDNDKLVVLSAATGGVVRTVALAGRPELMAVAKDGSAFVSLRHAGVVAKVAPGATKAVSWEVGVGPVGVALSADEQILWVALSAEDRVIGLSTATGEVLRSVSVAPRPRRVLELPATAKSGARLAVSHEWGRVTEIMLSAGNGVPTLGQAQLRSLRNQNPSEVAFNAMPMNNDMSSKSSFNGQSSEPATDRASRSVAMAATRNGGYLVSHTLQNRGAPANGGKVSSGYGGGSGCSPLPQRPMQVSVTPRVSSTALVASQTSSPVRDPKTERDFLARFDQPVDIVHHPQVSLVFLVATGTDNVLVLNSAVVDPISAPLAAIDVGQGPRAIALSPDGKTAWVLNGHSFTLSRVDLSPLLDKAVADGESATKPATRLKAPLLLKHTSEHAYGNDPLPPLLQKGRRIFHHTPNAAISEASRFACASCHYEGDEDKKIWFVEGEPRQTPALAGRLLGTAPFNWKGTEHGLQNNMNKTIERMGGEGLSKGDLEALEAFLTQGLVPPPNPSHRSVGLTQSEQRGKDLFNDPKVACASCHTAGTGTVGLSFDVGVSTNSERMAVAQRMANETGKNVQWKGMPLPYDTPSLRGVWHTAPYFHNGRAATLKEALKLTATTMGRTDHLTEAQLDDLVAYLKTL